MTIIVWTLLFAVGMIVITKIPVALAMKRQFGQYDNKEPRNQERNLIGFGNRALGAHENSIEAFPIFAVGALLAAMSQPNPTLVATLCSLFIVSRIFYTLFYLYDFDKLRSLSWAVGFLSSIGLMGSVL